MGLQSDYSPQALERLKFRRQFFLGPEFIDEFSAWKRIHVAEGLRLSVHPDLESCQATDRGRSITLLGYILDPDKPEASNSDVIDALLPKLNRSKDFWTHTMNLGGRWILIVDDGKETIAFNDAGGLRQVCYAQASSSRGALCASQPGLIAGTLGLAADKEALAYVNSREFDDYEVYWLPGDTTLYRQIRFLLPNHYLNLRTGEVRRYWPHADLKRISRREALVESLRLLRGLMKSIRQRYALALSLTAGWDSRVMLALSKDMVQDLYCFTLVYPHTEATRDVYIPQALLGKLGLEHSLIRYPEHINTDFRRIYKENRGAANDAYCADAQAIYDHYPRNRVCITGDVAEVVKCHYRLPKHGQRSVSARDLADLSRIGNHSFLLGAFERWLSTARPRNVDLGDLFCWEQMAGRWQALIRAQYDIVQECFAPFNCRSLLVTMLSVDEEYRKGPEHRFLRDLIQDCWSEVLSVAINPRERVRLRTLIAGVLEALGVSQYIPERARRLGKRVLK